MVNIINKFRRESWKAKERMYTLLCKATILNVNLWICKAVWHWLHKEWFSSKSNDFKLDSLTQLIGNAPFVRPAFTIYANFAYSTSSVQDSTSTNEHWTSLNYFCNLITHIYINSINTKWVYMIYWCLKLHFEDFTLVETFIPHPVPD